MKFIGVLHNKEIKSKYGKPHFSGSREHQSVCEQVNELKMKKRFPHLSWDTRASPGPFPRGIKRRVCAGESPAPLPGERRGPGSFSGSLPNPSPVTGCLLGLEYPPEIRPSLDPSPPKTSRHPSSALGVLPGQFSRSPGWHWVSPRPTEIPHGPPPCPSRAPRARGVTC